MRRVPLFLALSLFACSGGDAGTDKSGDKSDDTAASGDTDTDTDADTDTDTDTDTKDTGKDSGHDDTGGPPPGPDTGYFGPTRIVMIVDGATGSGTEPSNVVVYDPAEGTSTTVAGLTVRADAIPDCAGDGLFVLESRTADGEDDRVLRITPDGANVEEWALGSNFKPQDIASVGPNYWVAVWGKPRLLTFDPTGVAGPVIDLASMADSDGSPEANGVVFANGLVYVSMARQNQTNGSLNGARIVEFDGTTRAVTHTEDLVGHYPSGRMLATSGKLHVHLRSTAGTDASLNADGGIEAIDLSSFSSTGLEIDDSAADITQTTVAFDQELGLAWMPYNDSAGAPQVGSWSITDGMAGQHWPVPDQVTGIGVLDDHVWVSENPYSGGAGALVQRDPAFGTENDRVTMTGRIRGMAVCVSGGGGGGGETGAP